MSTISVHDVQGFSTYNNTVRIPNGHKLDIAGDLVLPVHTTSTRPSGELGAIGFNSQTGELEVYVEINGTNQWYALTKAAPDGSNAANAAVSGQQLLTDYPNTAQGVHWIKSSSMPNALQMYIDVTEDGGGYDFYYTSGGPSVNYTNSTNAGAALGLDMYILDLSIIGEQCLELLLTLIVVTITVTLTQCMGFTRLVVVETILVVL